MPAAAPGGLAPPNSAAFPAMPGAQPAAAAPAPGGAAGGESPLAALQNLPQFQQIRALVQQNPQALAQILPAIQMQQPQLFEYIQSHPEEFMALLQGGGGEGGAPGMPGGMPGMMPGAPPPGAQVVRLSPEEREAIERIQSMGFERNAVVEAYLVCDKNEEAAINFLLNNATFAD